MQRLALLPLVSFFGIALSHGTGCADVPASDTSASSADDTVTTVTQVVDTASGKVLADAQGLSLYTFDPDTTDVSNCNGGCARSWPPLPAPESADAGTLAAPFGAITRADGTKQVAQAGHPLYRYIGDHHQGDIKGEGLGGVWHLARPVTPPPSPDAGN
jgi:predicted lipoprotein with Yx(FWY)xxD motif